MYIKTCLGRGLWLQVRVDDLEFLDHCFLTGGLGLGWSMLALFSLRGESTLVQSLDLTPQTLDPKFLNSGIHLRP